ncbi:growth hormone-regulated TBC protein 1-like protein [Tanacetum coccineum]
MYGTRSKRDLSMELQWQIPILRPSIHARRANITVKFQDLYGFAVEGNVDDANILNVVREKVMEQGNVWWGLEASKGANWCLQTHVTSDVKSSLGFGECVAFNKTSAFYATYFDDVKAWESVDGNEPNLMLFKSKLLMQVIYNNVSKSRGFGFVIMSSVEDVKEPVRKFSGHELDGREIWVNSGLPQRREESYFGGSRERDGRSFNNRI